MKIRPVGVEMFRADGQTDRHEEDHSLFSVILRKAPEKLRCLNVLAVKFNENLLRSIQWVGYKQEGFFCTTTVHRFIFVYKIHPYKIIISRCMWQTRNRN